MIKPFFIMMGGDDDSDDETFFVVGSRDYIDTSAGSGMTLVTMAFGGIHCVAWLFAFPSPTEQLLWRISSIAITGLPLAFIGMLNLALVRFHLLQIIVFITLVLLYVLYPISRILLLVLSLSTLRSLPPSAYQTVQWTTFLPHV